MKRKIAKILMVVIFVFAFTLAGVPEDAFGTTSVSITGGEEIHTGEVFTISVAFTGDNTKQVKGQIGYDMTKLEYISGGNNKGNSGFIDLNGTGKDGTVTFNIKFRALKEGKTGIDVSSSEIYDNNKNLIDNCAISSVLAITGANIITDDNVVEETAIISDEGSSNRTESENSNAIAIFALIVGVTVVIITCIAFSIKRKGR